MKRVFLPEKVFVTFLPLALLFSHALSFFSLSPPPPTPPSSSSSNKHARAPRSLPHLRPRPSPAPSARPTAPGTARPSLPASAAATRGGRPQRRRTWPTTSTAAWLLRLRRRRRRLRVLRVRFLFLSFGWLGWFLRANRKCDFPSREEKSLAHSRPPTPTTTAHEQKKSGKNPVAPTFPSTSSGSKLLQIFRQFKSLR